MKRALGLTAAFVLITAAPIERAAAQANSQSALDAARGPLAATKEPLKLSEQDRAAIIKAVIEAKTHQKTPEGFAPAVGAEVPRTVYYHAFKPNVAGEMPTLKHYWYSHLDQNVALIDGLQEQVVAIIPLPADQVPGGQTHHGAAEPETEQGKNKSKDGASTTGSVPAYTSPETIR
jgi:hypothetical protein